MSYLAYPYQSTIGTAARADTDRWSDTANVKDFGAQGDAQEVRDGVVEHNNSVVTSASANFAVTDIGKIIWIVGGTGVGTIMQSTIVDVPSATTATMANTCAFPSPTTGAFIIWGSDDTLAIQAAIDLAAGSEQAPVGTLGRTVFFPDGRYLHSGLVLRARTTLRGTSFHKVMLSLTPNINRTCISNATPTDDYLGLVNLTIDGSSAYQLPPTAIIYHGLTIVWNATGGPDRDYFHRFEHVKIQNCGGDGWQAIGVGRGENHYLDVSIQSCNGYGLNWTGVDSRFVQISCGRNGRAGFKIDADACQFVACKGYYNGTSNPGLQADGCNWAVDGWGSIFTSCESAQSWSSGWYVSGGNHQFNGCRSDDSGDLADPANQGGTPYTGVRSGLYLDGSASVNTASDNNFSGFHIGVGLNVTQSYMTNAVYFIGNCTWNQGTIFTQNTTAGGSSGSTYSVSKVQDANAGGVLNNKFTVDGVVVT